MLQLIFNFEKDSEAEANMATSLAPAATAASKPYRKALHQMSDSLHICNTNLSFYVSHDRKLTLRFGVNTGKLAPSTFRIASITSLASAS